MLNSRKLESNWSQFKVPYYTKANTFDDTYNITRWLLKCFVKFFVSISLVEYHHSSVDKASG